MITTTSSFTKLCLHWPTFGPYHVARLRASREFGQRLGIEIHALETAGRDSMYRWRGGESEDPLWHCLFPDGVFQDLPPELVRRRVFQRLDRIDPDGVAICSYSFPDARACLEWCRKNRRVAIVMTDSKEEDARRFWLKERLKAIIVNQFDSALLAGEPNRRYFSKLGFDVSKIFLGYDVVDNEFFAEGARAAARNPVRFQHLPGIQNETPFFLTVSRLLPFKNVEALVEAYGRYVTKVDHPWRLVIVGDGSSRNSVERLASGLAGVTLAGHQEINELSAYYGRASAFILPTLRDTWGLVVNEAMAAGLPVIVSSRAGCSEDLVRSGCNGHTFHPEDIDRLVALMVELSAESDLDSMGECSRDIISNWTLDRFADSIFQAVQAGAESAKRPFDARGRIVMTITRMLARDSRSFHSTVE